MNKNIIRGSLELAGFNNHLYGTNTDGECIHLAVLVSEFDMYFDDFSFFFKLLRVFCTLDFSVNN